ncbi:diguanylate cyclase [Pseudomethylobacillus aquaticus]|uniref:Diguanylate cyclase n=1 Tax=Pseudomethylobacillus aquaticus TaxID=2676064 RepID=A0A3N0V2L1_9PROT|nr:VOC family protein [Pseudomethylobacillus aquaticus]ROH87020.1 diguanylate cyclase [Pseudomethylobacillus aquaticus]
MSTLGIAHINIRAPRALLEQLHAFYREVVGLQDGPRPPFTRFGYWLYAGGHDVLHLIEASPEEQRLVNVITTVDHIAFKCTDLPETTRGLQQRGIPYRVTAIPLSQQQQIVLKDPAGNTVELNFADAS